MIFHTPVWPVEHSIYCLLSPLCLKSKKISRFKLYIFASDLESEVTKDSSNKETKIWILVIGASISELLNALTSILSWLYQNRLQAVQLDIHGCSQSSRQGLLGVMCSPSHGKTHRNESHLHTTTPSVEHTAPQCLKNFNPSSWASLPAWRYPLLSVLVSLDLCAQCFLRGFS